MLARWNPAAWVPAVIGGILLVAAGLKLESLQFERSIHSHLSAADAPTLIAIVSEIFIAVWLFSGHAPTWARRATMLLLAVFLCTAAWRWYAGEADCGCFGAVAVHPAWTTALDAAMLLSLWISARPLSPRFRTSRRIGFAAIAAACLASGAWVAARHARAQADNGRQVVTLDPTSLRGHRFPLLDYMDNRSSAALSAGRCTAILFDRDCHKCAEYIEQFDASPTGAGGDARIWEVDISPRALVVVSAPVRPRFRQVQLRRDRIYAIAVPVAITLRDGIVQDIDTP